MNGYNISVKNIDVYAGSKQLIVGGDLVLNWGKRYALLGYNGVGKTTLLNYIYERRGEFKSIPENISIFLVEQEFLIDNKSVLDTVLECDMLRKKLLDEEMELMEKIEKSTITDKENERLIDLYEELNYINSDRAESIASKVLRGLQFTEDMFGRPAKEFSGGWRMRISLARALYLKPKLLLLDEPTNHLDLNANIWLQDYLQTWEGMVIIVSHDHDFINNVSTDILQIWQSQIFTYKGRENELVTKKNGKTFYKKRTALDIYYRELENKIAAYEKNYEQQQKDLKRIKRLNPPKQAEIRKIKEKRRRNRDNLIKVDPLAETKGILPILKKYKVSLSFKSGTIPSSDTIFIKDVSYGYKEDQMILNNITAEIKYDNRIALVGANGSGKSTFLNLIYGNVKPISGTITLPSGLKIGLFSQFSADQLDVNLTAVEYLHTVDPSLSVQEIRKYLGRFGIDSKSHNHKIERFSGGQKARLVFIELSMSKPHFMILDEPTNNLDIESVTALKEALEIYDGGYIVVTHNLDFIENLCDDIWICQNSHICPYNGTIYDYVEYILADIDKTGN